VISPVENNDSFQKNTPVISPVENNDSFQILINNYNNAKYYSSIERLCQMMVGRALLLLG